MTIIIGAQLLMTVWAGVQTRKGPKSHKTKQNGCLSLHAVLLLPFQVLLPERVDTVDHDLDQLNLRVSKTMLVGNVISASSLATRFSTSSTGLYGKFFTASLKFVNRLLGPARKVNMNRCTHTSSEIGGARVDISILLREGIVFSSLSFN